MRTLRVTEGASFAVTALCIVISVASVSAQVSVTTRHNAIGAPAKITTKQS